MLAVIEKIDNDADRDKLEQWYISYKNLLHKIAYEYTNDYDKTEDLINETFVHIIRHMDTIDKLNNKERACYLVTTMKNVCIDYLRKSNKEKSYCVDVDVYGDDILNNVYEHEAVSLDPEKTYLRKEFFEKMDEYMLELCERDRNILIMKLKMGLSEKEIAKALGIKEQNVHSYFRRAKDRLIKIMNGDNNYDV